MTFWWSKWSKSEKRKKEREREERKGGIGTQLSGFARGNHPHN